MSRFTCAGCYARHESVPEVDLTDSEALALAAEVSVDAEDVGLALDAWGDLGSGKNFSLFCNGKRVTPDEDAARLGGNRTHVRPLQLRSATQTPSSAGM